MNGALDEPARIERVPVEAGDHRLVKTTCTSFQQSAILAAIGSPTPRQNDAA